MREGAERERGRNPGGGRNPRWDKEQGGRTWEGAEPKRVTGREGAGRWEEAGWAGADILVINVRYILFGIDGTYNLTFTRHIQFYCSKQVIMY